MRTQKTLKNSIYIIISYFMVGTISIFTRKLFVMYLPLEFLGYEGLFGNIFTVLSLADLGIGTLITYRLYPAFANRNKEEIAKLMTIYKYVFRIVGFVVLVLGILFVPFLKFIVKDNSLNWEYIYLVYIVQLATTLCTYFLAYKRLIFTVDQCVYKCVQIDMICSFFGNFLRILIIVLFKSYILYLLVNILSNIISNGVISFKAGKEYEYINKRVQLKKEEFASYELGKDIKNYSIQKVSGIIYGGTDNIVISAFLGIKFVALLGNYSLITGYVATIIDKMLESFQAAIGNFVYSSDREKGTELFRMFDLAGYFLSTFIVISYLSLLNPLIKIWLGEEFLLDNAYVFVFALNEYIKWNHKFLTYYRYTFGKYELDRNYILMGAILNIVCSVFLAKSMGIAGVMLGTVIGHIGFWVGRVKVVYSVYLCEKVRFYVLRQIRNFAVLTLNIALMQWVCYHISDGIKGFIIKIFLCILIPNIVNLVIFIRTKEMRMIFGYFSILAGTVKSKIAQLR